MPIGEIAVVTSSDAAADDATGSVTFATHHSSDVTIRVMSSNGDGDFTINGKVTGNASESTNANLWTVNNASATGSTVYFFSMARLASLNVAWVNNTGTVQVFAYVHGEVT